MNVACRMKICKVPRTFDEYCSPAEEHTYTKVCPQRKPCPLPRVRTGVPGS